MPGMIKAPDFVGYFPLNPKGMSGAFNKIESSAEKKRDMVVIIIVIMVLQIISSTNQIKFSFVYFVQRNASPCTPG